MPKLDGRRGKSAADHAAWLKTRGYVYEELGHYLPHDAEAREEGTAMTFQEILAGHGIHTRIAPRLGVEEGISAARMFFGRCWFDEKRCEAGLRSLLNYRREWKDRQGQFASPIHDWASHGADAFRYFAVSSKTQKTTWAPLKYSKRYNVV